MNSGDERLYTMMTLFGGLVVGSALVALVDWAARWLSLIHV